MDNANPLEQAILHLQHGALREAGQLLETLLQTQPQQADVLHMLGLVKALGGEPAAAASLFEQASLLVPGDPGILANLARARCEAGLHEAALSTYDALIAQGHGQAGIWTDRGTVQRHLGCPRAALKSYRRALACDRGHANAWLGLGNALHELRRFTQALPCHERALALTPQSAPAWSNRGATLVELGYPEQALDCYRQAIALDPANAAAWSNWGVALRRCERPEDALTHIDRALALQPAFAEAWINRGATLLELKRPAEALASFEQAIGVQAQQAAAWNGCGMALHRLQRHQEAAERIGRAIALDPDAAECWVSNGLAQEALGQADAALACMDRAIAVAPRLPDAWIGRGYLLGQRRRHRDGLAQYDEALKFRPGHPDALFNQALTWLVLGEFERGWRQYEARWKRTDSEPLRHAGIPLWLGREALAGKRIVLWAEQGYGDTLQMCRYVPLVAALAGEVVLEAQAPLAGLLASLPSCTVVTRGQSLPVCDYQTPLMSLPLAFGTRLETIPRPASHLYARPQKIQDWARRLDSLGSCWEQPRIGIACSGNPGHDKDRQRSLPLQAFAALQERASLFLLQKGVREQDMSFLAANPDIHYLGGQIADFEDVAAIVANLDLVISADTALAHLAGAIGQPAWILLPWAADWRWLEERGDSPWYPAARLFRQEQSGRLARGDAARGGSALPACHAVSHAVGQAVIPAPARARKRLLR